MTRSALNYKPVEESVEDTQIMRILNNIPLGNGGGDAFNADMAESRQPVPSEFPTRWQRQLLWNTLSIIAMAAIAVIAYYLIRIVTGVISYLQPILIPFAIAGVLAYLLEPVVQRLGKWGVRRLNAVLLVFFIATLAVGSLLLYLIPEISTQGVKLSQKLPAYTLTVRDRVMTFVSAQGNRFGLRPGIFRKDRPPAEGVDPASVTNPAASDPPDNPDMPADAAAPESDPYHLGPFLQEAVAYGEKQLPNLLRKAGLFLKSSVGGFLGVFGFLFGLLIVPIYLFFFLKDGPTISENWSRYLPIRASKFKNEVVGTLVEINGYLMNFFRGQLLVSLINGVLTGIGLLILGLDYALLIGLLVGVLGLIPYIGILLCWIPAVIISAIQWPGEWLHPLLVSGIFFGVQQLEGLFISPKIVGESVGLHPLTVIVSLFAWSLLLGGLLGAILAVPLTATVKVLLKRYVWEKRRTPSPPPDPEADLVGEGI